MIALKTTYCIAHARLVLFTLDDPERQAAQPIEGSAPAAVVVWARLGCGCQKQLVTTALEAA